MHLNLFQIISNLLLRKMIFIVLRLSNNIDKNALNVRTVINVTKIKINVVVVILILNPQQLK
jgi:hypothetical protein